MKKLPILLISIFTIYCSQKLNHQITDPTKRVEKFLDLQTENSDIPGIQYVVVDSNGIILESVSGYSDIKNDLKIQSHSTMMAYSMTKTFTAVAILQLVESGKIELDDPVSTHLSEIPYGDEITIRQLIAHTSGIPNPIPLKWAHLASKHLEFDESVELSEILVEHNELSSDPGEEYAYSNIGYWLLGKIIEDVAEISFEEYMSRFIFAKLGLEENSLSFTISDSTNHVKGYLAKYSFFNMIKGFLIDDDLIGEYEKNWLNIKPHYLNGPAFGGMIGSAKSFSLFLKDQLKSQSVLLGKNAKRMLYTQQHNNDGDPIEMTLGWHIGDLDNLRYYFKEGGGGGYHCEMRVYPEQGIGTVIMVNCTNFNSKKYLDTLDNVFISQ